MPYCPECLTEYVRGTNQCEDCGAELLPGSPPPMEETEGSTPGSGKAIGGWLRSLVGTGPERDEPDVKLVRARIFSGPTAMLDANVARSVLQANHIAAILQGEASEKMLPVLDLPLLVREEDAERAREILREYFDRPMPEGPQLVK